MYWPTVIVIGRILAESGSPSPTVDDPALLLIKRQNVVICPPPVGDAGVDAGVDAGDGSVADAGVADAGIDAGPTDAGVSDAGVDAMPDASTCTTFENAVTMILEPQLSVSSDGTRFAVLLVTPERPLFEVKAPIFGELARITAPKIVTNTVYIEDPQMGEVCQSGCESSSGGGCGDFGDDPWWEPPGVGDAGLGDGGLVEEMVGPYQFVRAKPSSTTELASWLDQLGYDYEQNDLAAVGPYIDLGYHVVAVRVSVGEVGSTSMPPIALTWPGTELRVPAALGRIDGLSPSKFTVYIAAEGKYAFGTNSVRFARFTSAGGMGFLTKNEIVLDQYQPPPQDPVAYRADDTPFEEVHEVTKEVRVPVEVPCDDGCEGGGCCSECNAQPRTRVDLGLIVIAVAFVLRRRRR